MSRGDWRCRNPRCGTVLGHRHGSDLQLTADAQIVASDARIRSTMVCCLGCGARRTYSGGSVYSARPKAVC
jgi:hypothetical protein